MAKGGVCVDGQLNTTLYDSPVPLIGLYIAVGTMVCFFCMSFDLVYGLIRRKPFLPCKLFPMNAFTMTVLAVATKIPLDLTTSMPRAEDQLSKLTATALMCTCIGFYIPSLGTMGSSERYGNMAALSVMVITMAVNVCIQIRTGVIFAFIVEHIIIIACNLLLLLLMWSSAITFGGQIENVKKQIKEMMHVLKFEFDQRLTSRLVGYQVMNYTGNYQTLFCETSHHHAFGVISALCFAVVLQAMLRLFAPKNMRLYCGTGASDYKWSIPIVIMIQFLTIALGTFSIIYRWLSFLCHTVGAYFGRFQRLEPELENLKTGFLTMPISLGLLGKKLSYALVVTRDFILDAIQVTQILLYYCTSFFFGVPSYIVKIFLVHTIPFDRIFHEHTEEVEKMLTEMSSTIADVEASTFSFLPFHFGRGFNRWIGKSAIKDMMRWRNACKRDHPTHLIQLLSKWQRASASSAAATFPFETGSLLVNQLEASGKDIFKCWKEASGENIFARWEYEYRFSCISVLVLSAIIKELMPSSSSKESLMKSLSESFEAIYFVDQKCNHTGSDSDRSRLMAAKEVWAQWNNPNHWFQDEIVSVAFQKKTKESESHKLDSHRILRDAISNTEAKYGVIKIFLYYSHKVYYARKVFIAAEFSVLSKFILEKLMEFERDDDDDDDLWLFLEVCFERMLNHMLSRLPEAIIKEIGEGNLLELEERRVKKALKFFCKLELLGDTIEWSWPQKEDNHQSRANDAHSNSVSNGVDDNVVSNSALVEEDDVGIKEIQGSDENV